MASQFRIRLVTKDIELEAEGDRPFVLEMLERFSVGTPNNLSGTAGAAGDAKARDIADTTKGLSAREFIQKLGFKRHTDRVAAFGYYLEHHSGKPEFTPADINNLYYEAKMETSNTSQAIIQNIKRSHLMEAKTEKNSKKKRYTLTQTGEQFIENKLAAAK